MIKLCTFQQKEKQIYTSLKKTDIFKHTYTEKNCKRKFKIILVTFFDVFKNIKPILNTIEAF